MLGLGRVVISLGAEGALFVEAGQAVQVRLPPVQAVSTVGAGDAMVAGLTAAALVDAPLDRAARLAAAFCSAPSWHRSGRICLPGLWWKISPQRRKR